MLWFRHLILESVESCSIDSGWQSLDMRKCEEPHTTSSLSLSRTYFTLLLFITRKIIGLPVLDIRTHISHKSSQYLFSSHGPTSNFRCDQFIVFRRGGTAKSIHFSPKPETEWSWHRIKATPRPIFDSRKLFLGNNWSTRVLTEDCREYEVESGNDWRRSFWNHDGVSCSEGVKSSWKFEFFGFTDFNRILKMWSSSCMRRIRTLEEHGWVSFRSYVVYAGLHYKQLVNR